MKSPFPGMDPYLEMRWRDVHASLMVYGSEQLNEQLPSDLQALVEENVGIADDNCADEVHPFRMIEVVDNNAGGRLVTAIEVLSPATKVGQSGREAYLRKRHEYLEAGVNLVEIDLIRQGEFILAVPPDDVPDEIQPPYLFCIRRAQYPGRAELFHAPLRDPLPNIPVPLRPMDADVVAQLQPLIDQCYRGGRHDRTDYRQEPTPRLSTGDAEWADQLLREQGRR